jgi:regulator of protease activity HflC (stomatin/prohibitin superfamily)
MSYKSIKYLIIGIAVAIALLIFGCTTVDRIGVGSIGVKVKLAGSGRGVQDMQLKTGWVWFNPLTEEIIEFPTKVENMIWTKDPNEGLKPGEKPGQASDESITFSSREGVNANADIGFSFHIQPDMAPNLYARFKQNDMHELAYGYMRNVVRDAFNEVASKMAIQDIYGASKSEMLAKVLEQCRNVLSKDGIIVDQLTINGNLRLPPNVTDAINNAIAQTQSAIQSENKVRQIKAEAEQAITAAGGAAESARQKATGEADALIIRTKADAEARITNAESQAKANRVLNSSLTPQVIHYRAIDQWDGKLPSVMSGGSPTPMFNVNQ